MMFESLKITPTMLFRVRDEMRTFVSQYVTPISASEDLQSGEALGTGNYLQLGNSIYILTNAHIASARAKGHHLAHLPTWNDYYHRLRNPMPAEHWPVDVAITHLDSDPTSPRRSVLPVSRLASRFAPVQAEMLFWLGYPGSTAGRHDPITATTARRSLFGLLHVPGVPVLTQVWQRAVPPLQGFDPEIHIVLHYPASAAKSETEVAVETPNPAGMSGSLLWDTRFIACYQAGRNWSPDEAEVCGLLWAAHHYPEVAI